MRSFITLGSYCLLGLGACGGPARHEELAPRGGGPAPSATATATSTPPPIVIAPAAPPTVPTTVPTSTPPPVPTEEELLPPLFAEPVVHASRAVPIVGGTLLVSADGSTAVAADPDRDQIFLVDLATLALRSVAAEAGDEPGRLAEGAPGTVYVVARRAGAILRVDLATGSIGARIPVCAAPRGLAYDAASARLHVACRSGVLASIDTERGEVVSRLELDEDLRDVLVRDGALKVTRFRSAELLTLDGEGNVLERERPTAARNFSAAVAFRAVSPPNGSVLLAHQVESDNPLGAGLGAYYGGSCFGGGVVQQAISVFGAPGATEPASFVLPGLAGPTDLAVSRDGTRVAVVASGNAWLVTQEQPTLFLGDLEPDGTPEPSFVSSPCTNQAQQARYLAGEPVAVAFDATGRYIVQSREPALLQLEGDRFVSLSQDSRFDTGFASFYLNTGGNISCASCHPEGGDDGHTWVFSGIGYRRTQSLAGGISQKAPFHWSGDLATFEQFFQEVMLGRMALPVVPPSEHVRALATWLDTLPYDAPGDDLDAAAVERGRVLFHDELRACSGCHSGPTLSDGRLHDVGTGGSFVTPSLRGVAVRAPLLHDGCAATLAERFGPCGGTLHGDTSLLGENELLDLIEYMKSL